MRKIDYYDFLKSNTKAIKKLKRNSGALGFGLYIYLLDCSFGLGRCYIDLTPSDRLKICEDSMVSAEDLCRIIGLCMDLELFHPACLFQRFITSKDMQLYFAKNTLNRDNITIPAQYALIDIEAIRAEHNNKKATVTYPKELYNYAFEKYEEKEKILDYKIESVALKKIFTWIEKLGTLNTLAIDQLIELHLWAIYESNNEILMKLPFKPSAITYKIFDMIKAQRAYLSRTLQINYKKKNRIRDLLKNRGNQ